MKEMNTTLKNKIASAYYETGITTCKWNDIYDTEEELIKDLFNEKVLTDEDTSFFIKFVKVMNI